MQGLLTSTKAWFLNSACIFAIFNKAQAGYMLKKYFYAPYNTSKHVISLINKFPVCNEGITRYSLLAWIKL